MTLISIEELRSLCLQALTATGLPDEEADIVTDHYLENELSGKSSHGMVRVVEAVKAIQKYGLAEKDQAIVLDNDSIVVCDSCGHLGPAAGKYALDIAAERAKEHGMAFVGIKNYIGSSGSLAYYLRRLAAKNLIGIMGCNSVAMVAPPGGRQRKIGTNPLGIVIPSSDKNHLVGDIATSAIAYGKIMVMNEKGENVPEGKMIDKDGNPSANPADAYDGAILPLEDHKGFALGLFVELLAGPLIGAKAIKENLYDQDGLFIIAIDPQKFGHIDFPAQMSAILGHLRDSPARPGFENVSLPGDRSHQTLKHSTKKGEIEVADKTLETLKQLSQEKTA